MTLYHVTHSRNRESIRTRGLLPRKPSGPLGRYDLKDQPAGVYLSTYPQHEWSHVRSDVWAVDCEGLTLQRDRYTLGYVYPHRIRPHRLTLEDADLSDLQLERRYNALLGYTF